MHYNVRIVQYVTPYNTRVKHTYLGTVHHAIFFFFFDRTKLEARVVRWLQSMCYDLQIFLERPTHIYVFHLFR